MTYDEFKSIIRTLAHAEKLLGNGRQNAVIQMG